MTSIIWANYLLNTSLQHDGLQKCIRKLNTYTQKWGLEVCLKQTRCLIFSKGHTKYDPQKSIAIGNDIIPFENFYKYLGVEISDNCKYSLLKKDVLKRQDEQQVLSNNC